MKTQQFLQSLSQQFKQWQRQYKVLFRKGYFFKNLLLYLSATSHQGKQRPTEKSTTKLARKHSIIEQILFRWLYQKRSSIMLVIAILSLTGVIGYDFYNQPKIKVNHIASQTFIAPYTDSIEDWQETERKRQNAIDNSRPILMINQQINNQINQKLETILDTTNQLREMAGTFPFFDTSVLSLSSQNYLRFVNDSEWQKLKLNLENNRQQNFKKQRAKFMSPQPTLETRKQLPNMSNLPALPLSDNLDNITMPLLGYTKQNDQYTHLKALSEIELYQATTSAANFSKLIAQISQVRQRYNQAINEALRLDNESATTIYAEPIILNLSGNDWLKIQIRIRKIAERILAQGISPGLPENILNNAVVLQVRLSVPSEAESLVSKILLAVIKPNLTEDKAKTQQKAELAAEETPPVILYTKQGQIIVSKGEKITEKIFQILAHYHLIGRQINWISLMSIAIVVTIGILIFIKLEIRIHHYLRQRDYLLILLLTLTVPGVLTIGLPYTTWSAIGLLLGSFYGPTVGLTVVGLLSLILPFSMETSNLLLLAGAVGGMFSSYVAHRLRSREELALLGLITSLGQAGIYLLLKVVTGRVFGSGLYVFQEAGLFAVSGLSWSIIALGLSAYLETIFDLITPIRLAELANPNRPLLKRLATETPGTFQHTLLVATLAEAAAKELKCNVELVRAGTLYHDIGKMHDPLAFIENQMGTPNKHETEIKDPWKSAELIKKHVTQGLLMAKKHNLPTAIQAFIPEHQGTMAIAYFYHQAQQIANENPHIILDKADFCYDGPIPQSRETGIVMLADSCEAALRSLKDATPEQALSMLNNIVRAKWQDEQLIDSGLTKAEMPKIAQIFVEIWQQFHHKRIAYPKSRSGNS
ncbi:MAG: HD family phosphohydrolase [Cuspidothrix sp.]